MDALAAWFGPIFARGLDKILSTTHPALAVVRGAVRLYVVLLAALTVACFAGVLFTLAVYLLGQ